MTDVVIWHNPRCSKSRQALALLQDRGITPEIRRYLDDPPSRDEILAALDLLGLAPSGLVRKGEAAYRDRGLAGADNAAILDAMAADPRLIERPVVFAGARAALGRPPETILTIL